jgi:hypothetical protein
MEDTVLVNGTIVIPRLPISDMLALQNSRQKPAPTPAPPPAPVQQPQPSIQTNQTNSQPKISQQTQQPRIRPKLLIIQTKPLPATKPPAVTPTEPPPAVEKKEPKPLVLKRYSSAIGLRTRSVPTPTDAQIVRNHSVTGLRTSGDLGSKIRTTIQQQQIITKPKVSYDFESKLQRSESPHSPKVRTKRSASAIGTIRTKSSSDVPKYMKATSSYAQKFEMTPFHGKISEQDLFCPERTSYFNLLIKM